MNPFSSNPDQNQSYQGMLRDGHNNPFNNGPARGQNNRGRNGGYNNQGAQQGGNYHNPGHWNGNPDNRGNAMAHLPPSGPAAHDNPNPRYKGKRYDPNHHQKQGFPAQQRNHGQIHPRPFPPNGNQGAYTPSNLGPQRYAPAASQEDFSGDIDMFDADNAAAPSTKHARLEQEHAALKDDIRFFLQVLDKESGGHINTYLQQFVEARSDSPLAAIVRQV